MVLYTKICHISNLQKTMNTCDVAMMRSEGRNRKKKTDNCSLTPIQGSTFPSAADSTATPDCIERELELHNSSPSCLLSPTITCLLQSIASNFCPPSHVFFKVLRLISVFSTMSSLKIDVLFLSALALFSSKSKAPYFSTERRRRRERRGQKGREEMAR